MAGNLFYDPEMTVNKAMIAISSLLRTVRNWNGVGAIDWQVRAAYPGTNHYKVWGTCYVELLKLLSSNDDIWVATGEEILTWFRKRELLVEQRQEKSQLESQL